jgi:diketogulonate reductase-like aldo/keto reductase
MDRIRDQIFLATKVEERAADRAWASINNSLERLRVNRVDLLQLHSVGDLTTLDSVTRSGGALQSAVRAMDEGMVGAIGITGHGPAAASTHLEGAPLSVHNR